MKYGLGKQDLEKILKGLVIALGGALLTYVADIITKINFGDLTPVIVALGGVILNICWKLLDGVKK
jgi:hypothetical protein